MLYWMGYEEWQPCWLFGIIFFEGYAFAGGIIVEVVNHGYLAVDFFLYTFRFRD